MDAERLATYLQTYLDRGYSFDSLRERLLSIGFSKEAIEEAATLVGRGREPTQEDSLSAFRAAVGGQDALPGEEGSDAGHDALAAEDASTVQGESLPGGRLPYHNPYLAAGLALLTLSILYFRWLAEYGKALGLRPVFLAVPVLHLYGLIFLSRRLSGRLALSAVLLYLLLLVFPCGILIVQQKSNDLSGARA